MLLVIEGGLILHIYVQEDGHMKSGTNCVDFQVYAWMLTTVGKKGLFDDLSSIVAQAQSVRSTHLDECRRDRAWMC